MRLMVNFLCVQDKVYTGVEKCEQNTDSPYLMNDDGLKP